jgi:hypothetical protein
MITELEFLDGTGSESIAPSIETYDGEAPSIGDLVYLDTSGQWQHFRVVDRVFYLLMPNAKRKISLYCHPAETGTLGH